MEKTINWIGRKGYYTGISIILILAVILFISSSRNYWRVEEVPFCFIVLISLFGLFVFFNQSVKFDITAIDLLVLLYFFYIIISSVAISFPSFPSDRLYTLSGYLIYYVVFRLMLTTGVNYRYCLFGIVLLTSLESFLGILQYIKVAEAHNLFFKAYGTFTNPGIFGGFVATGLPVGVFLIDHFRNRKWMLSVFCCFTILILIGLILSGSRTAMISAIVATLLVLIVRARNKQFKISIGKKVILIFTIVLISVPLLYLVVKYNPSSIMGRFFIWRVSWTMFLDHPVFGLGYGKYAVEYGNYQALYFNTHKASEPIVQLADMNYLAFNELVRILLENGVIGLSIFLLLISGTLYAAFKSIKQHHTDNIPFFSILIVILFFSLFSYPFDNIPISLLFYLSIAFISVSSEKWYLRRVSSRLRTISKTLIASILLLFIFRSSQKINAFESWQKAQRQLLYSERSSWARYEKAYATLSNNATFMHNYGAELTENGDYTQALDVLNEAKQYGNSVELQIYIARCYFALKKYNQAEAAYIKAANMNPKLFRPLENLLSFYISTKQHVNAKKLAKIICRKLVKIPSKEIDIIKYKACRYTQLDQDFIKRR